METLSTSGKSPKPYGPYDVVENLMISQSSLISPYKASPLFPMRLMDEIHNTQTTPVARTLGRGKGKEVAEDSDIEELDGPPSSKPSGSGSG